MWPTNAPMEDDALMHHMHLAYDAAATNAVILSKGDFLVVKPNTK
jgi:hypothetical protein